MGLRRKRDPPGVATLGDGKPETGEEVVTTLRLMVIERVGIIVEGEGICEHEE